MKDIDPTSGVKQTVGVKVRDICRQTDPGCVQVQGDRQTRTGSSHQQMCDKTRQREYDTCEVETKSYEFVSQQGDTIVVRHSCMCFKWGARMLPHEWGTS